MRSHSSSHRSSFSRSHRSGIHHSSMHRSSIHHSSLSRSSIHRKSMGASKLHKSSLKRNGISNAHAFTVGKATGININGSALGAHGAALHRFKTMRKISDFSRSNRHSRHNRIVSSFTRRNKGIDFNNKNSTNDFIKRMRVSHNKHHYTTNKYDYSKIENMGNEINATVNELSKYIWIPFVIGLVMFFIIAVVFTTIIFLTIKRM